MNIRTLLTLAAIAASMSIVPVAAANETTVFASCPDEPSATRTATYWVEAADGGFSVGFIKTVVAYSCLRLEGVSSEVVGKEVFRRGFPNATPPTEIVAFELDQGYLLVRQDL